MAARMQRKGEHPEDIKAALRKQYGSLTLISEQHGWHRATIPAAIRAPRKYPAASRWIAEALNKARHTLWPDHYQPPGGERSRTVNDPQPSRQVDGAHRQKRSAA